MRTFTRRFVVLGVVLGLVTAVGVPSVRADLARASSRVTITSFSITAQYASGGAPSLDFSLTDAHLLDGDGSVLDEEYHMETPALPSQAASSTGDHLMTAGASVTDTPRYASATVTALAPGLSLLQATASIWEDYLFSVPDGEGTYDVTVRLAYIMTYDAYTEPGLNVAIADAWVSLTLGDVSGNIYASGERWLDELGVGYSEGGWGNGDGFVGGSLLVNATVPAGQTLWVDYTAWAIAATDGTVVPLPGAVLLGSLGLSLTGWRLRRARA